MPGTEGGQAEPNTTSVYNSTLKFFGEVKAQLGVDSVDLLLSHWPGIVPEKLGHFTPKQHRQQAR